MKPHELKTVTVIDQFTDEKYLFKIQAIIMLLVLLRPKALLAMQNFVD